MSSIARRRSTEDEVVEERLCVGEAVLLFIVVVIASDEREGVMFSALTSENFSRVVGLAKTVNCGSWGGETQGEVS
jgi:hypothetical protein